MEPLYGSPGLGKEHGPSSNALRGWGTSVCVGDCAVPDLCEIVQALAMHRCELPVPRSKMFALCVRLC